MRINIVALVATISVATVLSLFPFLNSFHCFPSQNTQWNDRKTISCAAKKNLELQIVVDIPW
jgi:hypothetical protein